MIYIGIWDRDAERRRSIRSMAGRYFASRKELHGQVRLFGSSDELRAASGINIFLVNAQSYQDLEKGGEIREAAGTGQLIFYSESREANWASKAFKLGALQFLPMPVEEGALFEALDRAVHEGNLQRSRRIGINSTEGLVNLKISEVAYAKSSGHRITFFLRDGSALESKCLRVSFGNIIAPLLENGFVRCHDSYVVNLSHVVRLTAEGLLLAEGMAVPVSAKKRGAVKAALDNSDIVVYKR